MTPTQFLARLTERDIHLSLNDSGGLRVSAPDGAVTDAIQAAILRAKPALLGVLSSPASDPTNYSVRNNPSGAPPEIAPGEPGYTSPEQLTAFHAVGDHCRVLSPKPQSHSSHAAPLPKPGLTSPPSLGGGPAPVVIVPMEDEDGSLQRLYAAATIGAIFAPDEPLFLPSGSQTIDVNEYVRNVTGWLGWYARRYGETWRTEAPDALSIANDLVFLARWYGDDASHENQEQPCEPGQEEVTV
jgi:hypothetical protein